MGKIFIAGCGYMGKRVAILYRSAGQDVVCMVRSQEHAEKLSAEGFEAIACSLDTIPDVPLPGLGGSILFYLVPPPGGGNMDSRARNFCAALSEGPPPAKIIYMSATSVYAADGSVVTEASPAAPDSAMGKRRLDAEGAFRQYSASAAVALVILRVSGIYGPGRLPLMQIRQRQPVLREEDSGPSNRIHGDDLAQICLAAAEKGLDGDVFNVSDGHPSSLTSYFDAVCDALGEPRLPRVTRAEAAKVMTPLMLSYYRESRRVDSSRMQQRLGVKLRYPSLPEGVRASVGVI